MKPDKDALPYCPIAIVGMACVFPGANAPEELWQNVLAGRRYFRKAPEERLPPTLYMNPDPTAPDKSYCDEMAVISDWKFDPVEFRVPPVTYLAADIAHWLALWTADRALLDSGLDLDGVDRTRIGVILGNTLTGEFSRSHNLRSRWPYVERAFLRALGIDRADSEGVKRLVESFKEQYCSPLPTTTEDSLAGNMANTIAGRICGYYDLGGGGFTLDGACSSSLLAVAHSCEALSRGELDFAITGGVDVSLDTFEVIGFSKTGALAKDDIRPYDLRANGMLPGEGCGIFILQRETAAREAGRNIHAVLKGWGWSSDGRGGITAPAVEGQVRALERAYARAGYGIDSVGLIEGHGTGTTLGDKVEIQAIQEVVRRSNSDGPIWLGTIKGDIGHCKAAAGAAGLTKVVMALKRKVLPPTGNCSQPNALLGDTTSRVRPLIEGRKWESSHTARRASVSAMGFGGSNSHVTLEEANPDTAASEDDLCLLGSRQESELIVLSADARADLARRAVQIGTVSRRISRAELSDLAAHLADADSGGSVRVAIVAESPWGLAEALRKVSDGLREERPISELANPLAGIFVSEGASEPRIVALFPGQGSQRLNMGKKLLGRYRFNGDLYAVADQLDSDVALSEFIFRDTLSADEMQVREWTRALRDTRVAQPAIVLSSVASLAVLRRLGLQPTVSIGHSLGEITALHAAGAFDGEVAVQLAMSRGRAMACLSVEDPGGMIAVSGSAEEVATLIERFETDLEIANYNSPRQTVIAGRTAEVERFISHAKREGVQARRIPTSHAFHSRIVAPAAKSFARELEGFKISRPSGRILSTSAVTPLSSDRDVRQLLTNQICRPVRFMEAVEAAAAEGPSLWVEIGPGNVLSGLVSSMTDPRSHTVLATEVAGADPFDSLNRVLANAYVRGASLDLPKLYEGRHVRPIEPASYNPVFITNPCERPPAEAVPARLPAVDKLRPADVDEADFEQYLVRRGEFVRELLAIDYQHSLKDGGASTPQRPGADDESDRKEDKSAESGQEKIDEREAALAFALEWVSERTGYPVESLTGAMRLQEDLNLDSIKVGEMVVVLSRKLRVPIGLDAMEVANARISELVDRMIEGARGVSSAGKHKAGRYFTHVDSLENWVGLFEVDWAESPLPEEDRLLGLPEGCMAVIAGEADNPHVQALAETLREAGICGLAVAPLEEIVETTPERPLCAVLAFMPEFRGTMREESESGFRERVDYWASALFRLSRWALEGGFAHETLRVLVVRSVNDESTGADLDAGAGFLKSLALEYPNSLFKWITLPAGWTPDATSATILREIQQSDDQISFQYYEDGRRMADRTIPLSNQSQPTCELGPDDVVLVTGGAKGITAELALGLAKSTGAQFALVGSSQWPNEARDGDESDIARNLKRFADVGITARYFRADVTDAAAVKRVFEQVHQELGPVTALIHGAGITNPARLADMELANFLHCIRIKTTGLYNLLSAVQPSQLKALHVVSSVLGRSGMRGQVDYCFANAWLDGAVRDLSRGHPHLHALSLGYTVWDGPGLGQKIGALDGLKAIGVRPITVDEGVQSYLALLQRAPGSAISVITARLSSDLERTMYGSPGTEEGDRFLEHVLRWVPGIELVAEADISKASDLYLTEHIFNGTTVFPGVMAIEMMAQAACRCAGKHSLPVMQEIRFAKPVIVPNGDSVRLRVWANAKPDGPQGPSVRVVVRSNQDDFATDHYTAVCVWELQPDRSGEHLQAPSVAESMTIDPESLWPDRLFQGKFFRRIEEIHRIEVEHESLTTVRIPSGATYYSTQPHGETKTPSPAARDAFLQSAALTLAPGYLPERIEELRFYEALPDGETVRCWTVVTQYADLVAHADVQVFSTDGKLIESMRGLVVRKSPPAATLVARPERRLVKFPGLLGELETRMAGLPYSVALVDHEKIAGPDVVEELTSSDLSLTETDETRRRSRLANLLAARRAVRAHTTKHLGLHVPPGDISLDRRSDGKPEIRINNADLSDKLGGIDISLSDSDGKSVAFVGPGRIGIDIERVENRDAEMWRGLLGDDGYALALDHSSRTFEPFDQSATRVWTLIEAGKKARDLQRMIPVLAQASGDSWARFVMDVDKQPIEFLSGIGGGRNERDESWVLSIAVPATSDRTYSKESRISLSTGTDEAEGSEFLDSVLVPSAWQVVSSGRVDEDREVALRFVTSFSDCCGLSRQVPFHQVAAWMGKVREVCAMPIGDKLEQELKHGRWGLVTNRASVRMLDEIGLLDVVEVRIWSIAMNEVQFAVQRLKEGRPPTTVAVGSQAISSIAVVGHGQVEPREHPRFFREFMSSIVSSSPRERGESTGVIARLPQGDLVKEAAWPRARRHVLLTEAFDTSPGDGNAVGNIWFGRYFAWQARLLDRFLGGVNPDYLRQQGRLGELMVRSSEMTYFIEAMPLDSLEARLVVLAEYERGVRFGVEFWKSDSEKHPVKLSFAELETIWVIRSAEGLLETARLPEDVQMALETGAS